MTLDFKLFYFISGDNSKYYIYTGINIFNSKEFFYEVCESKLHTKIEVVNNNRIFNWPIKPFQNWRSFTYITLIWVAWQLITPTVQGKYILIVVSTRVISAILAKFLSNILEKASFSV
ncbi:unnamed protein product [Cryptosporidium hominis]|uniref:Uncharacterized protein n=1 Tax=Cryptosporidium hominis TaxID=237895 RepID=A0A0S4TE46_CRYHO|nr:Uncharacterized protein GY17_00003327 [Cryptosporidium hominis]CUV05561.1 unnamed protein product [Cryptosporidium hominis]|eukprot:PPS92681.1 Uncharacterized protein GY17_00003327 [Cryptosporidium hominis]